MRTLTEVIDKMESTMDPEEIVELFNISSKVLLERFDDYVELRMDQLNEELFDELP